MMHDTSMTDRTGIEALYREALIEAYLFARVPRERVLRKLGRAQLAEIETQRDALRNDLKWGMALRPRPPGRCSKP